MTMTRNCMAGAKIVRPSRYLFLIVMTLATLLPFSGSVTAQDRTVPRQDYLLTFSLLRDGNYLSARRSFQSAARSGIRSSEGRWVDSICYHTMVGETYYQMGDLANALDQYDWAVKLILAHQNWLLRIDFPPTVAASQRVIRPAITWGNPSRRAALGHFPDTLPSLQGQSNAENARAAQVGGVIAPQFLFPLRVTEILRCSCLAIRRRGEIMGVTCGHSELTNSLIDALSRRPAPPNHWSQAWIDVQLGLAYASAGKKQEAVAQLQRSLLAAGQFDHPLTGTALLALGKLAFQQEQYPIAANYFLEATFTAAAFSKYELVEEAFRWGALTHMASGGNGVYPPLAAAVSWAKRTSRALEASLLLLAAENYAAGGETTAANGLIDQALRTIRRSDMLRGEIGARLNYIQALVAYLSGNVTAGDKLFSSLSRYQVRASKRLFQIGLADALYTSGTVTERVASLLFDHVLRESTSIDWVTEPRESLAIEIAPHELPMEHWFEVALKRKELEKALEITDRIKRHRFHATLPMGGRLLALRWILEGPAGMQNDRTRLQRQDILGRFPQYAQLSAQARALRNQIGVLPLVAADAEAGQQLGELYSRLAAVSAKQESMLRIMALRRMAADQVFPPIRQVKQIQQELNPGQLILAYHSTARSVHGFAIGKETYGHWQVESPRKVKMAVSNLLQRMGHLEKNVTLDAEQLRDDGWKESSRNLLTRLANGAGAAAWQKYKELIIVPDGALWYVPFEAMHVEQQPLMAHVRIRYAPTTSLTIRDRQPNPPEMRTAVAVGKLFPRNPDDVGNTEFGLLQRGLPGSMRLPTPLPVPARLLSKQIDRLIVLDEIQPGRSSYEMSPLPDANRPGSSLGSWMQLPWGGPQQVVLPAFHTAAENSLKRGGNGNEIFHTLCGLMACGTRTVLIGRWRTGGQSSYDLIREFARELPHSSADAAWHRSVRLTLNRDVDAHREPRLQLRGEDGELKTSNPFFWAGYLLVDTARLKGDAGQLPPVPKKEAVRKAKDAAAKDAAKGNPPARRF